MTQDAKEAQSRYLSRPRRAGQTLKLLPCPFCGGAAKLIDDLHGPDFVNCVECGVCVDPEMWNHRTLPAEWEQRKAAAQTSDPPSRVASGGASSPKGCVSQSAVAAPTPEPASGLLEICNAPAVGGRCMLTKGHNRGHLDIPSNHLAQLAPEPAGGMPELPTPRSDAMWLRQLARFAKGENREHKAAELNRIASSLESLERDLTQAEARPREASAETKRLHNEFEKLGAVLREKDFQLDEVKKLMGNIEHWFEVLSDFPAAALAERGEKKEQK